MISEQIRELERQLWSAADNLRANSDLKSSEYSVPVLGLIFLKFADNKYKAYESEILKEYEKLKGGRREKKISDIAIEKCGFYLPDHARYDYLLELPDKEDIAMAIKEAMKDIEKYKPELDGILPQDEYFRLVNDEDKSIPKSLLKNFADIPEDATGDMFGQIYEYFLGKFAMAEGQGGGEFFTPRSVVRLMVEIIEPQNGTVFDPACGSGGMFVQSSQFIDDRLAADKTKKGKRRKTKDLYVYGQEKTTETVKLAKMNIAVNGLRGEVLQGNTYQHDRHESFGKFDYVLANPPFNVDEVNLNMVKNDPRFNTYGIPQKKSKTKKADEGKETVPNANYLWINLFATSLNDEGRAALVMANSASDARHSEADIRKTLIDNNLIYAMLTLPSNMFYTVTLPATLWFFDKAKQDDRILFIDARNIFTQIDRAHREFSEEQIANIALIPQLHKGRRGRFVELIDRYFREGMEKLQETQERVGPVAEQVLEVLDGEEIAAEAKQAVDSLVKQWKGLKKLQTSYDKYMEKHGENNTQSDAEVDKQNKAQHKLRESFDPFFEALHEGLKSLDRIVRRHQRNKADAAKANGKRVVSNRATNEMKKRLFRLHAEVGNAEGHYIHIHWLQQRFPNAEYEDNIGLCKLATSAEIVEQDYSLNPGRYVGVVVEEDGKTEEEFVEDMLALDEKLVDLSDRTRSLEEVISANLRELVGEV